MKNIANMNSTLQQGLAAAQRVFAILDLRPRIADRPGATPLGQIRGDIRFDGVHFRYTADGRALEGIDLEIAAGKTVALVGPSGAGKSTVLTLIPRFYEAERGAVDVRGGCSRTVDLAALGRGVAGGGGEEQQEGEAAARGARDGAGCRGAAGALGAAREERGRG
jgi:subfamily B ATP-binding cassette protein MsbA